MKRAGEWGLRLFTIHVFFIGIVWLASYFSGLELVFASIYLWIIWQVGAMIGTLSPGYARDSLLAGLIAQFPGFFLTAANIKYYWGAGTVSDDYTFAFQIWHTPAVPLLSLFPHPVHAGFELYFLALFILSPLYLIMLCVASCVGYRSRSFAPKKL